MIFQFTITRFNLPTKVVQFFNILYIECRVVRFKISDDTYESIITNLDESEFNIQDIKELYHLRWEIETSYRELKYHLDLNALHSKKKAERIHLILNH